MESDNKKIKRHWKRNSGTYYFLISIIVLFTAYFIQEYNANRKIKSCPIVTVAYPDRFVPRSTLYYHYTISGEKIESGETMTFPTMGKFERGKHLMQERFWVKIYCKDYKVNRIYWDAKVPDTLQYVPVNGWDKIPYGLDKDAK